MLQTRSEWIIPLLVLLAAVLRLSLWTGISAADDIHMAHAALRWLDEGAYVPDRHLALRVGLSLPLAGLFAIFGIGEWQMAIIPMLASLSLVVSTAYIARHYFGAMAGLMAGIAVTIFPLDIFFSGQIYPDIPFGAASAAAIALFLKSRNSRKPTLYAILSGLLWGYSYLIKIEAAFLALVFLALFLDKQNRKLVIISCMACGAVVATETIVYWIATGEFLYRLKTVLASNDTALASIDPASRFHEAFAYPKAWFVTFYYFGLQYYFAVFGIGVLLVYRPRGYGVILTWIAVMLLWLQFGGNPFATDYVPKTKLLRYCSFVTGPVMVTVGVALAWLFERRHRLVGPLCLVALVGTGLFFAVFNLSSAEREVASKDALRQAGKQGLSPLYMDNSSLAIGQILAREHSSPLSGIDIASLDEAEVLPNGRPVYMLINPQFIDMRQKRYINASNTPPLAKFRECGQQVLAVNNPLKGIVYLQVRILTALGSLLPGIGPKVEKTGEAVLASDDAIIFAMDGAGLSCLAETGG